MSPQEIPVLAIGLDSGIEGYLASCIPNSKVVSISNYEEFERFLSDPPGAPFGFVFCGPKISELQPLELAQSVRMQFSGSPIFFVTSNREGYERANFVKNGFDDSFLMPLDEKTVKNKIELILSQLKDVDFEVFRPVKLIDVKGGTQLNFDVSIFMPRNNKYIKYSNAGETLDEGRVEKLTKHKVTSLYVPLSQMQKFYDYTAERLAELGKFEDMISETERKEKLQSAVRDIFSNVFNVGAKEATIQEGKKLVEDCQNIVKSYILHADTGEWYKQVENALVGEKGDSYSHASSVSTFAALFAIGLNKAKAEDMAIAGLFHDIGLADIPSEILKNDPSEWTNEEKSMYQLHPEYSIRAIKQKKLIIPPIIQKAISQHHERFDGSGFPAKSSGTKICIEAQILALADEFDYLTRIEEGKKQLRPRQAIQKLMEQGHMDAELLKQVLKILPEDATP